MQKPLVMEGKARLRLATAKDAPRLFDIRSSAIIQLAPRAMGLERAKSWAASARPERVVLAIEQHTVWVADTVNEAVGWIELADNCIEGMYVLPERTRAGIGTLLLDHAEGEIQRAGFRSSFLEASRNAEPFYLNRGYKPLGERPADDAVPMEKQL